ncbi:ATP-dependent DNA helicase UvrD2 [Actinomyces sp. B33]|uniref:ATP-dependent DNA helicase UvrD2 n=1 Tax=Actinomyces sp. B33 TaxID=2942131 RepID=UPI0023420564|nr:ATP-dependent DNA helicase UvrD2 [Actinomyces sp. B33]MDC4233860.1 ATP-dependent DNA helicase UvrD2 [Actinomyces sp. B33]
MTTTPDEILDALDPDQRAVATRVAGPLAVLAGAGTGKTRAITYRIAYGAAVGAYDPSNVLAVTFTKRAAYEMRHRLAALGVPRAQAHTFHAAALRQLRYFWPTYIGGPVPDIVPHKASLVYAAGARLGIGVDKALVRDLAAEIEWSKVSLVDAAHYPERARSLGRQAPAGVSEQDMARLLDVYEEVKAERGVIDFEDVLTHMCGLLQERPEVASAVRAQYRHFVVDEFQDVNLLQHRLLDLWLGGRHDVCVVGDVAQTIYSFTGATPEFLTGFARRHPGAAVLELVRDYRSTPQIVSVANSLMALSRRASGTVRLVSQNDSGPAVAFRAHGDDRAEAEAVASRIRELLAEGVEASRIAVLIRMNSQSQILEEVLSSRQIPVAMTNSTPFFRREDVRSAVAALRAASIAPDEAASPLDQAVVDVLSPMGWSPEMPVGGAAQERWADLNAIIQWAQDSNADDLAGFVAELSDRAQYQVEPDQFGVELTTIHAAKGLEWDAVFVIGAAEGLLPISYAKTPEAREEERRLLYVAITRARRVLEISWARARSEGGRGSRRRSRLLDGIWPEEAPSPAAPPAHARKTTTRAANREFEETQSAQTIDLFARLRAWRLAESKARSVPPYAVFSDRTLRDIAIVAPKTLTQMRVISGVGQVKIDRHGPAVLAIVRGEEVVVDEDEPA